MWTLLTGVPRTTLVQASGFTDQIVSEKVRKMRVLGRKAQVIFVNGSRSTQTKTNHEEQAICDAEQPGSSKPGNNGEYEEETNGQD